MQIATALSVADQIDGAARCERTLVQLERKPDRLLLSALPLIAEAAGLSLAIMGRSDLATLRAQRFRRWRPCDEPAHEGAPIRDLSGPLGVLTPDAIGSTKAAELDGALLAAFLRWLPYERERLALLSGVNSVPERYRLAPLLADLGQVPAQDAPPAKPTHLHHLLATAWRS